VRRDSDVVKIVILCQEFIEKENPNLEIGAPKENPALVL